MPGSRVIPSISALLLCGISQGCFLIGYEGLERRGDASGALLDAGRNDGGGGQPRDGSLVGGDAAIDSGRDDGSVSHDASLDGSADGVDAGSPPLSWGWWDGTEPDKACSGLPIAACGQVCNTVDSPCVLSCDGIATCGAECEAGSTCYSKCTSIGACTQTCKKNATCWFDGASLASTTMVCEAGSSCELQCSATTCLHTCQPGASCLLRCGAGLCDLGCEPNGAIECPDGSKACNHPCPPPKSNDT